MPDRLAGKVAFITGAARGQGRIHAVRVAAEGSDVIALDICAAVEGVPYPPATPEDLEETAVHTLSERDWQTMLDVNLTGVWHTVKASVPHLIAAGRGGSIILTSSVAGLLGYANIGHYVAAKHGVVGLMRTVANELAPYSIRVNSVHPSQVDSPMMMNDLSCRLFEPDNPAPDRESFGRVSQAMHALPIPWVEAGDVSDAVLFLASDEARCITGVPLPIDGGLLVKK